MTKSCCVGSGYSPAKLIIPAKQTVAKTTHGLTQRLGADKDEKRKSLSAPNLWVNPVFIPVQPPVPSSLAALRFGGSVPRRLRTKKSRMRRSPYAPPMPWSPPGITSKSKSLFALIKASAKRNVDSGGTLWSVSPTMRNNLPFSRYALSMFEHCEYQLSGSLLQILSGGM